MIDDKTHFTPEHYKELLLRAHDPSIARIKNELIQEEYGFYNYRMQHPGRVLVVGSGLGHDSFHLAQNHEYVYGIDKEKLFVQESKQEQQRRCIGNVAFYWHDISQHIPVLAMTGSPNPLDYAVFNMGTINNYDKVWPVILTLGRAADRLFITFYPPGEDALEQRLKMYREEGLDNVRVEGDVIVSDDGHYSRSIHPLEITAAAENLRMKTRFCDLTDFAMMADLRKI